MPSIFFYAFIVFRAYRYNPIDYQLPSALSSRTQYVIEEEYMPEPAPRPTVVYRQARRPQPTYIYEEPPQQYEEYIEEEPVYYRYVGQSCFKKLD